MYLGYDLRHRHRKTSSTSDAERTRPTRVTLDIPDEVRNKVIAEGNAAWLDELPSVVESLQQDWSLSIGATLRGGHAAFVVGATLADGTAAVLKLGVPGTRRDLISEATVLRLAGGEGCASLLRDDLDRDALLLERLGAALYDLVPDPTDRHDTMCDVAARLWRPVSSDVDLPTGADMARDRADLLPRLWEETERACSEATLRDALACMERRRRAHSDRDAVLVHGDVHDLNVLQATDGTFKLIDPGGLRAEPACDLGTIIRCNPGTGDDLHARAKRLAARTGVDATAIWEWGTIYRVVSGLYCRTIGFQPFGDLLLAEADRVTGRTVRGRRVGGATC
jgi:streptomycin 6-kinase